MGGKSKYSNYSYSTTFDFCNLKATPLHERVHQPEPLWWGTEIATKNLKMRNIIFMLTVWYKLFSPAYLHRILCFMSVTSYRLVNVGAYSVKKIWFGGEVALSSSTDQGTFTVWTSLVNAILNFEHEIELVYKTFPHSRSKAILQELSLHKKREHHSQL